MKSTTFAFTALASSAAAAVAPAYGAPAYGNNATSPAAPSYAAPSASSYAAPSASSYAAPSASASSYGSCQAKYDDCRSVKDPQNPPNYSACAAAYTACLGYSPFASNGTNTVTPSASGPDSYVTQIVTSLETYCPSATTLTYNSKTYTVTEPTTLTITDCPCKHTVPAYQIPPAQTITAVVPTFTTVCPTPTTITTKSKTYTVTSSTTLTITHCPGGCTVTTPASYVCPTTSAPFSYKPSGSAPPKSKASKPPVTVTNWVSSYTTVCPYPTTFSMQGSTYTVSSATTLTITHCPGGCPVPTVVPAPAPSSYSQPQSSAPAPSQPAPSSYAPAPSAPAPSASGYAPAPSAPAQSSAQAPAPSASGYAPAPSDSQGRPVSQISDGQIQAPATGAASSGAASASSSAPAQYTGAAEQVMAGGSLFAAGLAAALMI